MADDHWSGRPLLNLGCGQRWHPDWTNIDRSGGLGVISHDLNVGIPVNSGSAAAVYMSNLLEHLAIADAEALLRECERVLCDGGVLRVCVPDLEACAREYLSALERALAGEEGAEADHEWMIIELVDQLAREMSGGEMGRYLASGRVTNPAFVLKRIGVEGEGLMATPAPACVPPGSESRRARPLEDFRRCGRWIRSGIRRGLGARVGAERRSRVVGAFRLSGEAHKWMYDRLSLRQLLERTGFVGMTVKAPNESGIPDFERYGLEVDPRGRVYKPDGLFVEARRPPRTGVARGR